MALPLTGTPLLALQGGGPSPLYPPNKVVLYHDGLNQAVAELEFGYVLPALPELTWQGEDQRDHISTWRIAGGVAQTNHLVSIRHG